MATKKIDIRCVMCGDVDFDLWVDKEGILREIPFIYIDPKTKEHLCKKCASNNEEIYKRRRIENGNKTE